MLGVRNRIPPPRRTVSRNTIRQNWRCFHHVACPRPASSVRRPPGRTNPQFGVEFSRRPDSCPPNGPREAPGSLTPSAYQPRTDQRRGRSSEVTPAEPVCVHRSGRARGPIVICVRRWTPADAVRVSLVSFRTAARGWAPNVTSPPCAARSSPGAACPIPTVSERAPPRGVGGRRRVAASPRRRSPSHRCAGRRARDRNGLAPG